MFRDSKNTKVLSFKSTYKLPMYAFEYKQQAKTVIETGDT